MIGLTVTIKQSSYPARHVLVNSLTQAREAVSAFVESSCIGSSEWEGGDLRLDGKKVGCISYNGRAWRLDDTEMRANDSTLGVYAH